jgi:hypothetical protein
MKLSSYLVGALLAITLSGCSPRYQLQAGFDPISGSQTTFRLDSKTGETMILKSANVFKTYSIYSWEEIHNHQAAYEIQKAFTKAVQKDPAMTNDGPMTIK